MNPHWDDSPRAWNLRDRDVARLAVRLENVTDIEELDSASSNGLAYLVLAAQAGQVDRLKSWALLLGTARDAAYQRIIQASAGADR